MKSQNIFPILLGDRILRIKIGDFGVSKRLSRDSSTIAQTHTGSPSYMAPEVLFPSDSDGYTTAVDLWALGCVVYRMVTGGLPFPTSREVISYSLGKGAFPRQELDLLSLSNAALTFIESVVKPTPENRATAELALKSDWITSGQSGFQITTSLGSCFKNNMAPIPAPNTAATEPKSREHQDTAAETVVTVRARPTSKGYEAMAQLYLDDGENINSKDSNGWRALHFAAEGGDEARVQQLLDGGADKEARTNDGSTALHLAASKGHDSTAQLLIRNYDVDKKTKDNLGRTALFLLLRYIVDDDLGYVGADLGVGLDVYGLDYDDDYGDLRLYVLGCIKRGGPFFDLLLLFQSEWNSVNG